MICSHDGADPLDAVQVTVAINLSAEEAPWESSPEGADWPANELRLSKGGFMYFWRSCLDPIWNHCIRGPVRVWSVDDGLDERALTALEARDSGSLKRLIPEPADGRLQLREGLGAALAHLLDDAELIVGDGGAEFSGQADAPASARCSDAQACRCSASVSCSPPGADRSEDLSQLPAGAGKRRRVIGGGELAPAGRFVS
jgi:hypothetical protein